MSDSFNQQFNAMFSAAINGGSDAMDKLAERTGVFIQDKLRENAFTRKILPPQTVTDADLTRNVDDEGLQYIDDIEPDSIAMRVNMRGEPDRTYIEAKRYAINLSVISSERFQKSEEELRSYKMPLTKVIEQNTVKDIQEQVDVTFMDHVRAACFLGTLARKNQLVDRGLVASGVNSFVDPDDFGEWLWEGTQKTPGAYVDDYNYSAAAVAGQPNRSNIIISSDTYFGKTTLLQLVKVLAQRQLKLSTILLHESDWADILDWDSSEAGLELTSEITKDGYKYATLGGYTFVTTVRDNPDIIKPGQIFAFPSPEFLGRYLILENTKFFINKMGRFITMEAWEHCGMGFGNIKGVVCLLLSGADITIPAVFEGATSGNGSSAAYQTNVTITNATTGEVVAEA